MEDLTIANSSRVLSPKRNHHLQTIIEKLLLPLVSLCALIIAVPSVGHAQVLASRTTSSSVPSINEKSTHKSSRSSLTKVYVESWKTGVTKIKPETLLVTLNPHAPEYERAIKNAFGKAAYRLSIWPGYADERRTRIIEWNVELTGIKDDPPINLLRPTNDSGQDYFTFRDRLGWLNPLENPQTNGAESDVVPFLAKRIVKVEGFYCIIEVKNYKRSHTKENLDSITLSVEFANNYSTQPQSANLEARQSRGNSDARKIRLTSKTVPSAESRRDVWLEDRKLIITGRVVQGDGEPVKGALVSLHDLFPNKSNGTESVDNLSFDYATDAEGKFELQLSLDQGKSLLLYATTVAPSATYVPLTPPFRGLGASMLIPGKLIAVNTNAVIKVGDIPIHAHYHRVIALLGKPKETNTTDADEYVDTWMRLLDARGDVVSLGAIDPSAISADGSVALSLPEGQWSFDFSFHGQTGPWFGITEPVKIRSVQTEAIFVSVNRVDKSNDSELMAPGEARERLAKLGVSYDAASFIERAGACNVQATRLFLAAGIPPNTKQKNGATAVLMAAAARCDEVVTLLLAHGANPNPTDNGISPLMAASSSGALGAVKALLNKQADPNASDDEGKTALMLAAGNGYLDIVKALLASGAHANSKDRKGMTALDYAVQSSNEDVVVVLRQVRAKAN
jgi:hypothetical protein